MTAPLFFFIGLALVLTSGCAWLVQPPVDDGRARRIATTAARHNQDLHRFKGLAQVSLDHQQRKTAGRIALAAAVPDQIRVEWLSSIGQPVTSFAGDGETITIVSHSAGKFYHLRQSRTAFDNMMHIPIGIEELVSFIAGRPLLPQYEAAQIERQDDGRNRIILKNRWHGVLARLEIDAESERIISMGAYDGAGTRHYLVTWHDWRSYGAFDIPRRIEISTPSQGRLLLTMRRFWPNVDIQSEMFTLKPVKSSE